MQWYYTSKGERNGPVDDIALSQKAALGYIKATDLVWNETMGSEWKKAGDVPGIIPETRATRRSHQQDEKPKKPAQKSGVRLASQDEQSSASHCPICSADMPDGVRVCSSCNFDREQGMKIKSGKKIREKRPKNIKMIKEMNQWGLALIAAGAGLTFYDKTSLGQYNVALAGMGVVVLLIKHRLTLFIFGLLLILFALANLFTGFTLKIQMTMIAGGIQLIFGVKLFSMYNFYKNR